MLLESKLLDGRSDLRAASLLVINTRKNHLQYDEIQLLAPIEVYHLPEAPTMET